MDFGIPDQAVSVLRTASAFMMNLTIPYPTL
jgi:hypothetical protein